MAAQTPPRVTVPMAAAARERTRTRDGSRASRTAAPGRLHTFSSARVRETEDVQRGAFTCFFRDAALERDYRAKLWEEEGRGQRAHLLAGALAALLAAAVAADAQRGPYEELPPGKVPLAALLLALLLAVAASSRAAAGSLTLNAALLALYGVAFSSYLAVGRDERHQDTCSAGVVAFVAASAAASHALFPHLVAVACLTIAWFLGATLAFRWPGEPAAETAAQVAYAAVAAAVLLCARHWLEVQRRRTFLLGRSVARDLAHYRSKARELHDVQRDLRDEVFASVTSPVEDAVGILTAVARSGDVHPETASTLETCVKLLGSCRGLFAPSLDRVRGLDRSTHEWFLYTLVDDRGGAGSGAAGRGSYRQLPGTGGAVGHACPPSSPRVDDLAAAGVVSVSKPSSAPASAVAKLAAAHGDASSSLLSLSAAAASAPLGGGGGGGLASSSSSSSLGPAVAPLDEAALSSMRSLVGQWNFDAFHADELSGGRPLLYTCFAAVLEMGLLDDLRLAPRELVSFLTAVEDAYAAANPYHNARHAADVTQAMHFFLTCKRGGLGASLAPVERLAALVAGAVHDVAHPGRTNAFMVATGNPLALLYNDRSVLENHHCAVAFRLLEDPRHDFLSALRDEAPGDCATFRAVVLDAVLGTDLAQHLDRFTRFKHAYHSDELSLLEGDGRVMAIGMALKVADVSHTAKELPLHLRWTSCITDEFFSQGDEERRLGLAVSPFMDRHDCNMAQSQVGFIDFVVHPMMDLFVRFLERPRGAVPCVEILAANRAHWSAQLESQAVPDAVDEGDESAARSASTSAASMSAASRESIELSARGSSATVVAASASASHSAAAASGGGGGGGGGGGDGDADLAARLV